MAIWNRAYFAALLLLSATALRADVYESELLWEAGFDDDEVIFGVISGLAVDASGHVFVLDRQLTLVHRFDADGEYLGTVGREGEGPGEFSRVGDVFVSRADELGVVQRMPGKIVSVRYDGTAGLRIPIPEDLSSAPAYFFAARRAGEGLVILSRQLSRDGTDLTEATTLRLVDPGGSDVALLASNTQERDLANFEVDEIGSTPPAWAVGADGEVYVSEEFDEYSIRVVGPDGAQIRIIEREYESRRRNSEEMDLNTPRQEIRTREGASYVAKGIASSTDRDIQALYSRPDGSLWVLTSHGAFDPERGEMARFDVFDSAGQFMTNVTVKGDASFRDDDFRIHGDRLFVLRGQRAALRTSRGLEDSRDAVPMTVGCYALLRVDG